jgi:enterochelin esterase-like enzyme
MSAPGAYAMLHRVGSALATGVLLAATLTQTGYAAGPYAAAPAEIARTASADTSPGVRQQITVASYAGGSTVVEDPFFAPTVGLQTSYRVMLPAGYDSSGRHYPVLYMLHGVAGDSSEWQSIGLLEAADRMMARDEIDPFIIVLPNGGAKYWVNHASGERWADYVVNDVVAQVDRQYRTIPAAEGRAIGGLSMGGEGALRLALTNPQVFGVAAAHSPSLRTSFDQFAPELREIFGSAESWRGVTPLYLVQDTDTAYGLTMSIDIGEDDPWRPNVQVLHDRMSDRGIAHRFEVLPGEHAAEYWIGNVDHYLSFYGSALSASASTAQTLDIDDLSD